MTTPFQIKPVRAAADIAAVAELFAEYAETLPIELEYQGFSAELARLPGKYAPPRGELLLARGADGAALGCVGLQPLADEGCCEMKRLYLRPAARGQGLGRTMAEAVIGAGRRLGYAELRLDTLDTMAPALGLYAQLGFAPIAPYYGPTPEGTVFMGLRL